MFIWLVSLLVSIRRSKSFLNSHLQISFRRFFKVVGENGELISSLLQLALVLDRVGQSFGKVAKPVRHVVFYDNVEKQASQRQWLSALSSQSYVSVSWTETNDRKNSMPYQTAGIFVRSYPDGREFGQNDLVITGKFQLFTSLEWYLFPVAIAFHLFKDERLLVVYRIYSIVRHDLSPELLSHRVSRQSVHVHLDVGAHPFVRQKLC